MAPTITRTPIVDDDGTGTSGTIVGNAWKQELYDQIDAALAAEDAVVETVPHGGTGVATLAAHGVVVGNGAAAVNVTGAGTAGQVLTSNGASADPTFQNAAAVGTSIVTTTGVITALALPTGTGDLLIYMNNATLATIQGIAAGLSGQRLTILSIGAGQVDFAHQNAGATAANRLINFATSGNTSLAAGRRHRRVRVRRGELAVAPRHARTGHVYHGDVCGGQLHRKRLDDVDGRRRRRRDDGLFPPRARFARRVVLTDDNDRRHGQHAADHLECGVRRVHVDQNVTRHVPHR
jgi:hypothetical protein